LLPAANQVHGFCGGTWQPRARLLARDLPEQLLIHRWLSISSTSLGGGLPKLQDPYIRLLLNWCAQHTRTHEHTQHAHATRNMHTQHAHAHAARNTHTRTRNTRTTGNKHARTPPPPRFIPEPEVELQLKNEPLDQHLQAIITVGAPGLLQMGLLLAGAAAIERAASL